jgi:uncharacterized hydrophobic protein (TIGR00271 family)
MLHVRVVAPVHLRDTVLSFLHTHPTVIHLVHQPNSVRKPDGDLMIFDVPREAANALVGDLRAMGVAEHGAIAVEHGHSVFSRSATAAERAAPGDPTEAVMWEDVKARVDAESRLTVSWVVMLSISVLIAACGILNDAAILIIGAMVVGPDYGPVAAAAIGLHLNRARWIVRGATTLAVGFAVAIPLTAAMTLVIDGLGWTPGRFVAGPQTQTGFIANPDVFTVVVAVLAGVAGVLSLTQEKAGTLVGVLISVTTVPAAAGIGVYAAHGEWADARGSAVQLVVNMVVLAAVGGVVLRIERRLLHRRNRTAGRAAAVSRERR